ncbi:hypothetical protein AI28_22875 [bacteria symbiont BFo1 of Frankliniella occidentalis]|nr:hypothetical protein AI28_22875 [bacteria symbiont BFo1 of Frankliniella occidentalis]
MINELIEQIGGRERLEAFSAGHYCSVFECRNMASALLSVLDAKPVGEFYEFKPGDWYQRSPGDRGVKKWTPLYKVHLAASSPEWSNAQCMEFITVAFRHCEIRGDIEMDDIRLGVKMANAAAPAPGGDGG